MTEQDAQDDRLMKLIASEIDSKLAPWKSRVAAVTVVTLLFAVCGVTWADFRHFLFEKMYPPEIVYGKLKKALHEDAELRTLVASDIVRLIGARVDSGYSKTIYFGPGEIPRYGQDLLQFHAMPNQRVELSLRAQSSRKDGQFIITVNNKNLFADLANQNPRFDVDLPARDITSLIQYQQPYVFDPDAEKKAKRLFIHTIRVTPVRLPANAEATFELLVLVRNEKASNN